MDVRDRCQVFPRRAVTRAMRTIVHLLAAIVLTTIPETAVAAEVIPPDNSAVNQYTETWPTSGGNAKSDGKPTSPKKVLGKGRAKRLEALGPDGQSAAEVAAATAPTSNDGNEGRGDRGDSDPGTTPGG